MAAMSVNEADFGELSGAPAASGDSSLWGDAPMAGPADAVDDPNMWGGVGSTPANGSPAAANNGGMEMVRTAAELANIEKFGGGDDSPSGLELDGDAPKAAPRKGDDNLSTGPVGGGGASAGGSGGAIPPEAAAAIASLPPEKLEQIVREVVRAAIQPIVEKIAWEVVPDLAEDIIRDEIKRLTQ